MSAIRLVVPGGSSRLPRLSRYRSMPRSTARRVLAVLMMPVPPIKRTFIVGFSFLWAATEGPPYRFWADQRGGDREAAVQVPVMPRYAVDPPSSILDPQRSVVGRRW